MPNRLIRVTQLALYPLLFLASLTLIRRRRVLLSSGDIKPNYRYLLVPNHQSYLDIPMISASLPTGVLWRLGPIRFMLLNSIFDSRFRRLLSSTGFFPARSHESHEYGLDMARSALALGEGVMIFPEGRRSLPSESAPKHGVSLLADVPGVEVIPVHLQWHRQGWWRQMDIVVGRPFPAQGLTPAQIMARIYDL